MSSPTASGRSGFDLDSRPETPCASVRTVQWKTGWLLAAVVLSAVTVTLASGQQPAPASVVPVTPVQIENTNAAFSPTDVNVPQANPARPTVTTPAHLPPTGFLQFEQGIVRAGNSPGGTNGQVAVSEVVKIALTTRLLVQFLSQPYTHNTLMTGTGAEMGSNDPGDLQVGTEVVVHKAVGAIPTVSLGFIRRVRAGTSANLDVGDYSQSALALLGGDLRGGFHYDSNLLFNEQNDGAVRRSQFQQTLAITHALFPAATRQRLSGTIEPSHATQPFVTATSGGRTVARANSVDLLFIATYTVRPNLILDASVDRGLTSTSTHWQGGFGFTYLLPRRLWKDKHPVPITVGRRH